MRRFKRAILKFYPNISLPSQVIAALSKPLRLLFEESLGSALSVALESSVEEDLKKVQFAMKMLFGKSDLSGINAASLGREERVEDLLVSLLEEHPDVVPVMSGIQAVEVRGFFFLKKFLLLKMRDYLFELFFVLYFLRSPYLYFILFISF